MTELLTAAQMRAIEQAAIESGEVTGLELMERAGQGVVEAIFEEWPELAKTSHRAVVLCGPGNNGGDGFVVARLLKDRGWEVEVLLYGDPDCLPPDAKSNFDRWIAMGDIFELSETTLRKPHPLHGHAFADIYVDAILGTGLKRPLEGEVLNVMSHMAGRNGDDYGSRTVCIDAPSGLCLDSGRVLGTNKASLAHSRNVFAALTVTFDSPKCGHLISAGPGLCGQLKVVDIGVAPWRQFSKRSARGGIGKPIRTRLIAPKPTVHDVRTQSQSFIWAYLDKGYDQGCHKYNHGHALFLAGGSGHGGAARLASRGALRIGAGLVTLAAPQEAMIENAARLDAIMVRALDDAGALAETLKDDRLNALCLGPGLGRDRARDLVPVALAAKRATVLDADALTAFADDPAALFDRLHQNCVLTPHGGEFAHLFPDIADKLAAPATTGPAYSKVDATREAAARAGCTILFKGPDTVIADPSGRCSINSAHYDRAAPWLATAGSGDVLAGFITGLLARGFHPHEAASTAAWLHVECALTFGPGLIAEDLPEELPKVFKSLLT